MVVAFIFSLHAFKHSNTQMQMVILNNDLHGNNYYRILTHCGLTSTQISRWTTGVIIAILYLVVFGKTCYLNICILFTLFILPDFYSSIVLWQIKWKFSAAAENMSIHINDISLLPAYKLQYDSKVYNKAIKPTTANVVKRYPNRHIR